MAVVMPPTAQAAVPWGKSSLWVVPGSLKWICSSMQPGIINFPDASMIVWALGVILGFNSSQSMPLLMPIFSFWVLWGVTTVPPIIRVSRVSILCPPIGSFELRGCRQ